MKYSSSIIFTYYNDFEYGANFFENILALPLVMDQGFAKIYQVNQKSFLGIVKKKNPVKNKSETLISLNTNNVNNEFLRISRCDVLNLTKVKRIDNIPLESFFFEDKEGHRFEIQEFIKENDKSLFE